MKIGIPRALLYYYYYPFWKRLFEELNVEVVVSDETSKSILNQGIKYAVAEICVPIKLFVGHTIHLLEKGADYIFVPRMVTISEGEYFCPKFMGLPDLMKHSLEGMKDKILTCRITSSQDDISDYRNYLSFLEPLGVSLKELKKATKVANDDWKAFRMYNKMGYTIPEAIEVIGNSKPVAKIARTKKESVHIGLLGYTYNLYDDFVNMKLFQKLKELDTSYVTFDMLDEEEILEPIKLMDKPLFWTFSNKVLGAGYKLLLEGKIDGMIHVTAFGCGPDAFLSRLLELKADEQGIPLMIIRVDEHTGENHLLTRIEAFIDMIKRKKQIS